MNIKITNLAILRHIIVLLRPLSICPPRQPRVLVKHIHGIESVIIGLLPHVHILEKVGILVFIGVNNILYALFGLG